MNYLDFLNKNYAVRRTDGEKEAFRSYIRSILPDAKIETTADGKNRNVVVGDPLTAKVVCTAHYDTPASSLFPNLMIPRNRLLFFLFQFTPIILVLTAAIAGGWLVAAQFAEPGSTDFMRVFLLPYLVIYYGLYFLMYRVFKNPNNYNDNTSGVATILTVIENLSDEQRGTTAFILFDNEELGKKGSKAYFKDHKDAMKDRLLINFDCVGNGEHILFVAMEEAGKREEYQTLQQIFADGEGFSTYFYPIKGSESNSDYKNFPCGIGCMACRRSKRGVFYTPYLHTPKDIVAKNENIQFIADGMIRFISDL